MHSLLLQNFKRSWHLAVEFGHLTNRQIVILASSIPINEMEAITEGNMDMDPELVKNIRHDSLYISQNEHIDVTTSWVSVFAYYWSSDIIQRTYGVR